MGELSDMAASKSPGKVGEPASPLQEILAMGKEDLDCFQIPLLEIQFGTHHVWCQCTQIFKRVIENLRSVSLGAQ